VTNRRVLARFTAVTFYVWTIAKRFAGILRDYGIPGCVGSVNFCRYQDTTREYMSDRFRLPQRNAFKRFCKIRDGVDRVSRFIYFFIIRLLLFIPQMLLFFHRDGRRAVTILMNIYLDSSGKYDQAVSLKTNEDRFELQRFRYNLVTQ